MIGFGEVIHDITEQRQVEEQLRLQSAALQSAADAVMITDVEGAILWVNQSFTRQTGYADGEALGENPRLLRSGQHSTAFFAEMWHTIKAGLTWTGEVINKRKGGTLYVDEISITPVADRQGRWTHFVAIMRDVTQRKQTDEALRAGEAHLRTVLENLAEGVLVADLDGNILDLNRAALELHGFDSAEQGRQQLAPSAKIFEMAEVAGDPLPGDQWPLARIMRGESLKEWPLSIRRKSGAWQREFSYSGSLVADLEGEPLMAVMTIQDITGRA